MDKKFLVFILLACTVLLMGVIAFSKAWRKNVVMTLDNMQLTASPLNDRHSGPVQ